MQGIYQHTVLDGFITLRQLQNMNEGFLLAMPICQVWFSTDKLVLSQVWKQNTKPKLE